MNTITILQYLLRLYGVPESIWFLRIFLYWNYWNSPKKTNLSCRQIHFRNVGVCRSEIWGASFQVCLLTDLSTHPNFNTSTESIQSNLFLAVSCYNSTEKVKGCIWARCQGIFCWYCTKERYWWQKCTLFECYCILHESTTIEENIFISFSDGTGFFLCSSRPHEGLAICKAKTVPSFLMLQWNLNIMRCQESGRICSL